MDFDKETTTPGCTSCQIIDEMKLFHVDIVISAGGQYGNQPSIHSVKVTQSERSVASNYLKDVIR